MWSLLSNIKSSRKLTENAMISFKWGNKGKIQKKVLVLRPNRFWMHHAILMLPKDIKKKIKKKITLTNLRWYLSQIEFYDIFNKILAVESMSYSAILISQ